MLDSYGNNPFYMQPYGQVATPAQYGDGITQQSQQPSADTEQAIAKTEQFGMPSMLAPTFQETSFLNTAAKVDKVNTKVNKGKRKEPTESEDNNAPPSMQPKKKPKLVQTPQVQNGAGSGAGAGAGAIAGISEEGSPLGGMPQQPIQPPMPMQPEYYQPSEDIIQAFAKTAQFGISPMQDQTLSKAGAGAEAGARSETPETDDSDEPTSKASMSQYDQLRLKDVRYLLVDILGFWKQPDKRNDLLGKFHSIEKLKNYLEGRKKQYPSYWAELTDEIKQKLKKNNDDYKAIMKQLPNASYSRNPNEPMTQAELHSVSLAAFAATKGEVTKNLNQRIKWGENIKVCPDRKDPNFVANKWSLLLKNKPEVTELFEAIAKKTEGWKKKKITFTALAALDPVLTPPSAGAGVGAGSNTGSSEQIPEIIISYGKSKPTKDKRSKPKKVTNKKVLGKADLAINKPALTKASEDYEMPDAPVLTSSGAGAGAGAGPIAGISEEGSPPYWGGMPQQPLQQQPAPPPSQFSQLQQHPHYNPYYMQPYGQAAIPAIPAHYSGGMPQQSQQPLSAPPPPQLQYPHYNSYYTQPYGQVAPPPPQVSQLQQHPHYNSYYMQPNGQLAIPATPAQYGGGIPQQSLQSPMPLPIPQTPFLNTAAKVDKVNTKVNKGKRKEPSDDEEDKAPQKTQPRKKPKLEQTSQVQNGAGSGARAGAGVRSETPEADDSDEPASKASMSNYDKLRLKDVRYLIVDILNLWENRDERKKLIGKHAITKLKNYLEGRKKQYPTYWAELTAEITQELEKNNNIYEAIKNQVPKASYGRIKKYKPITQVELHCIALAALASKEGNEKEALKPRGFIHWEKYKKVCEDRKDPRFFPDTWSLIKKIPETTELLEAMVKKIKEKEWKPKKITFKALAALDPVLTPPSAGAGSGAGSNTGSSEQIPEIIIPYRRSKALRQSNNKPALAKASEDFEMPDALAPLLTPRGAGAEAGDAVAGPQVPKQNWVDLPPLRLKGAPVLNFEDHPMLQFEFGGENDPLASQNPEDWGLPPDIQLEQSPGQMQTDEPLPPLDPNPDPGYIPGAGAGAGASVSQVPFNEFEWE